MGHLKAATIRTDSFHLISTLNSCLLRVWERKTRLLELCGLCFMSLTSKVVALICRKDDQQQLYVANCGDSRAVMISGAGAVAMCGLIDPFISFWYREE